MDHYGHKSQGFIGDYFGDIGEPVKISRAKYYAIKAAGYRVTKVPAGSHVKAVMIKALIDAGISLESYTAERILNQYKQD